MSISGLDGPVRFSERVGLVAPKLDIQIDSMDQALRNGLWNALQRGTLRESYHTWTSGAPYKDFYHALWELFFKYRIDTLPAPTMEARELVKGWFLDRAQWYEVYDFVEFALQHEEYYEREVLDAASEVLERERSGYRFIGLTLTPLTSAEQIDAVGNALVDAGTAPFAGAREHLSAAVKLLSDRHAPDFRNSIKESISAVESVVKVLSADDKGTLGALLKRPPMNLHPALQLGYSQLYGYTSNADGIRHAMMEEDTLQLEDALYMLVSCSAFISYLIAKGNRAGLLSDKRGR